MPSTDIPVFQIGDRVVWTPRNSYGLDFKDQSYPAVITDNRGRYANGRAYYSVQRTELVGGDCHWGCRDEDELLPA